MVIREFKDSDLPQISKLYFDTVRNINSRDYSPEQVAVWAPEVYEDAFWARRFDNYTVFVAEEDGQVVGFCEFQYPGHIDCFYVHHEWQRRGVGSKLLQTVEKEAEKHQYKRLFADISITARPFFTQKGFKTVREQEKLYRELAFKLYFMEKYLAATPDRKQD